MVHLGIVRKQEHTSIMTYTDEIELMEDRLFGEVWEIFEEQTDDEVYTDDDEDTEEIDAIDPDIFAD
jgi:hypothetical protein